MSAPALSLILPAYRAEQFIEENVAVVLDVLGSRDRDFELLVVCDGGEDATADRARAIDDPRVQVIGYPVNQGKGFAICVGLAHARGRLIGWLDADLDIDPAVILEAESELRSGDFDAVVGSKRHPGSSVQYPLVRRFLSWGFQTLVRTTLRVDLRDTQTGAKLFRRELIETVAPLLLVKRFAFDLEVLVVAALFGFDRVAEIPIRLDYRFTGTAINNYAVRRMLVDTLALTYRVRVRHWYVRQFAALQRRRTVQADGSLARTPVLPASNLALFRELLPEDPVVSQATSGLEP